MGLTVGEVALIAAGIGLASPLIAYWTTARLDRERWIRAERSKVYVDMLAVYGRIARKVSHQEDEYHSLSPEKWRLLQARVEAFASNRVIALRDPYLNAWDRFVEEKARLAIQTTEFPGADNVNQAAHHEPQHHDEKRDQCCHCQTSTSAMSRYQGAQVACHIRAMTGGQLRSLAVTQRHCKRPLNWEHRGRGRP
jgi:hypothetical protein